MYHNNSNDNVEDEGSNYFLGMVIVWFRTGGKKESIRKTVEVMRPRRRNSLVAEASTLRAHRNRCTAPKNMSQPVLDALNIVDHDSAKKNHLEES